MGVRSLDHVGVVVDDLEAATAFFLDLGLEREGAGSAEGEWVERIIGLDDVQVEFAMVKTPDGSGKLELIKFHRPAAEEGARAAPANRSASAMSLWSSTDSRRSSLICGTRARRWSARS